MNALEIKLSGPGAYSEDNVANALDELKQWRDNVRYLLDDPKFAPYVVRVCEGGGPEDLIMSLVVSWNKMFNSTTVGEYLKPGGGKFS